MACHAKNFWLIVHMELTPQGRRVSDLQEVTNENLEKIPVGLKRLGPAIPLREWTLATD